MYPQIVDTELFEKVRKLIDKNKYGKRSVTVNYLLRHKIKCGYCGQSISAESGTAKNGQVKHYYKCFGRKLNNGCKKFTVRKDFLEQIVIDTVIEQLSRADIIDCM